MLCVCASVSPIVDPFEGFILKCTLCVSVGFFSRLVHEAFVDYVDQQQEIRGRTSPVPRMRGFDSSMHCETSHKKPDRAFLFHRLFETYPDTMGAFGPFRSINPEDVRFNQELRDHGLRVINTVSEVLKHRSAPLEIPPLSHSIACAKGVQKPL